MLQPGPRPGRIFTRRRVWCAIGFGVCGPLVTVALAWSAVYWQAQRSLDAEIARIVARGEPLTFADLAPSPGAELRRGEELLALLEQVPRPTKLCREMLDGEARYSRDNIRKLREEVLANRDLVARIVESTRDREILFPVETDHALPADAKLPHVMKLRHVSTHLRAEGLDAELSADRKRVGQAIADGLDIVRVARHDPFLVGALVRSAHIRYAIDDLGIALGGGPLPDQEAQAIDDRLKRLSGEFAIAPALWGDRAMVFETLARVGSEDIERYLRELEAEPSAAHASAGAAGPLSSFWCGSWLYRPRLLEQQAFALRAYTDMAHLIDAPGPDGQLAFNYALRLISDERRKHHLVSLQLVSFDALRTAGLQSRQDMNLGRLGVRIVAFAFERGALPQSLADVLDRSSQSLAIGLFSGERIAYERRENGFALSEFEPGITEPAALFDVRFRKPFGASGIVREDLNEADNDE